MANQNRRDTRQHPRPQNGQRRPARGRKKRKRINWFRVVVITIALVLVAVAAFGIVNAVKVTVASQSEVPQESTQPEFFSTIRPESIDLEAQEEKEEVTEPVYTSEFDGVLFVGDSLTAKLQAYAEQGDGFYTILGDADFLTDSDYSWQALAKEFSDGEASLELYGQPITLVDAIKQLGTRKVYIQLGKEDLVYYQSEIDLPNMRDALTKLHEACPEVEIIVQAVTPLMQWCYKADLDNGTVETLNTEMKAFCAANDEFEFLDIASELCPDGILPEEYCADPDNLAMHMNTDGCAAWTNYLIGTVEPESVPTATPEPNVDAAGRDTEEDQITTEE